MKLMSNLVGENGQKDLDIYLVMNFYEVLIKDLPKLVQVESPKATQSI